MPTEDEARVGMTEPQEDLGDPEALLKALRSEREARKKLEREVREAQDVAALEQLRRNFPFLIDEDVEGLPRDKWEARATRLAELRGAATPSETRQTENPSTEVPEASDLARAAELEPGRPADEMPAMTRQDLDKAIKAGKMSPAEGVNLIRTGKVALENQQVRPPSPFG